MPKHTLAQQLEHLATELERMVGESEKYTPTRPWEPDRGAFEMGREQGWAEAADSIRRALTAWGVERPAHARDFRRRSYHQMVGDELVAGMDETFALIRQQRAEGMLPPHTEPRLEAAG